MIIAWPKYQYSEKHEPYIRILSLYDIKRCYRARNKSKNMKKSYGKEFIGKIIRIQWLTQCKKLVYETKNRAGKMA